MTGAHQLARELRTADRRSGTRRAAEISTLSTSTGMLSDASVLAISRTRITRSARWLMSSADSGALAGSKK